MKKFITYLRILVLSFSLVSCGSDNIVNYKLTAIDIDEQFAYNSEHDKFSLKYNIDKNIIVFSYDGNDYKGTLSDWNPDEEYTNDVYTITWNKAPKLMMGFDVDTELTDSVLIIYNNSPECAIFVPVSLDYEGTSVPISVWLYFESN